MNINKFDNIEYLNNKESNEIQKLSYKILKENRIMEILNKFDPILVGTIPIEINIDGSDLDIICSWKEDDLNLKKELQSIIDNNFKKFNKFKQQSTTDSKYVNGVETIFCEFEINSIAFEIFAQPISTKQQNAYKHMIIEYQILLEKGNTFKNEIINLKKSGLKTEPAFAKLLNLSTYNNPYDELLLYNIKYNSL